MLVDGELGLCSLTFRERTDAVKCITETIEQHTLELQAWVELGFIF